MRIVYAIIAIATGILVIGGYYAGDFISQLVSLQTLLLNWAIILAGAAALVGIFNLIYVHTDKIVRREKGSSYSAFLVIGLVATLLFGMILRPEHPIMRVIVDGIIIPGGAALMGLLAITLIYSGARMLRRRVDLIGIVFLIVAIVLILGSATLPFGDMPVFGTIIRPWVTQVLALGGARGILIGVALGALTTGLRVLFGADRPYGGN